MDAVDEAEIRAWFDFKRGHGPRPAARGPPKAPTEFDRAEFVRSVRGAVASDAAEGFVVGLRRRRAFASDVCRMYMQMSAGQKREFTFALSEELGWRDLPNELSKWSLWERVRVAWHIVAAPLPTVKERFAQDAVRGLKERLVPWHTRFFMLVASVPQGMRMLIEFRGDVLRLLRREERRLTWQQRFGLEELAEGMRDLFNTQQGIRIVPLGLDDEAVLRTVVAAEAVHAFSGRAQLERRMAGPHRLAFGLFHPTMPSTPLAFVQVALCGEVAAEVRPLLEEDEWAGRGDRCAIFYAVSNVFPGLRGLNMASHLLFLSIGKIRQRYPACDTFATLSPVPGFRQWLDDKLAARDPMLFTPQHLELLRRVCPAEHVEQQRVTEVLRAHEWVAARLAQERWWEQPDVRAVMEQLLPALCSRYVLFERAGHKIADRVANFHTQNGALVHRVNFLADTGSRAMSQSYGLMLNYRYDLYSVNRASRFYRLHSSIAASPLVAAQIWPGDADQLPTGVSLYARVYRPRDWIVPRAMDRRGRRSGVVYFVCSGSVEVFPSPSKVLSTGSVFGHHQSPVRAISSVCVLMWWEAEDIASRL